MDIALITILPHKQKFEKIECFFRLPKTVQVFFLRSVNLLRKYSLVFDVPMSFLLAHTAYVASLSDWWTIQKAMSCHHSQYVWFRKAYMLFSRDALCK